MNTSPFGGVANRSNSEKLRLLTAFLEEIVMHYRVVTGRSQPFFMSTDSHEQFPSWIHGRFADLPDYLSAVKELPDHYEYHPYMNAFIACCRALNLLNDNLDWQLMINAPSVRYDRLEGATPIELFNTLVDHVSRVCLFSETRKTMSLMKRHAIRQQHEYCAYFRSLMNRYSRLIVIRVDASYKKEIVDQISFEQASDDLDRLLANTRHNSLFDGMVGYIFKTEYGIDKGIHHHLTFFFNGNERLPSSHVYLAQELGEYWMSVATRGRGDYWNCNAQADQFERLNRRGIGLIDYNDMERRLNLEKYVVGYGMKIEQVIRLKSGQRINTLRRGQAPVDRVIPLGRPRQMPNDFVRIPFAGAEAIYRQQ